MAAQEEPVGDDATRHHQGEAAGVKSGNLALYPGTQPMQSADVQARMHARKVPPFEAAKGVNLPGLVNGATYRRCLLRGASSRAQQRRIERAKPDWIERTKICAARDAIDDQLSHGFPRRRCVEDAPHVMAGRDIKALAPRHPANQGQAVLRDRAKAGLPRDDLLRAEQWRQPLAESLQALDRILLGLHGDRVEGQGGLVGPCGDVCASVGAWKYFDGHACAAFIVIFEKERVWGDIAASIVDDARTSRSEYRGKRHPF